MIRDLLAESPLDSARFGLHVLRGRFDDRIDASAVVGEILARRCDVAIIRLPSGQSAALASLPRLGLPVLQADTLVYYACDLTRHATPPLRNADLELRPATPADADELRPLVAHTFDGYVSHYHANPLFDPTDVLAGYQQWAEGYARGRERTLWVARRAGRMVAFAACEARGDEAEGVLYGVAPEAAGGGLYGDLIRHTQDAARALGARRMKVSTQVGNFAVQKVWAREGFHMVAAYDTLHVNALLSAGEPLAHRDLCFDEDAIRRFADATGDCNPIHLDAAVASRAGFEGPIAHGVLAAGEISRLLGTESPGPGTLIRRLDLAFHRPLVAGRPYRFEMRHVHRPGRRAGQAIATVRDGSDALCLLARSELAHRDIAP